MLRALTRQDWRNEVGVPWAADSIGRWELTLASPGFYDVRLLFDASGAKGPLKDPDERTP